MPRLDMADLRAAVKKVQVDDEVMQLHTAFIHRVLNMVDGAAAVLSNGRVGEPFAPYFKLSAFFNRAYCRRSRPGEVAGSMIIT